MRRLTPAQFIQRATQVHGDRYTYPGLDAVYAKEKIDIQCPIHGLFQQRPHKHLSGQGCRRCMARPKPATKEELITKAQSVHGDKFIYDEVSYLNNQTNVTIICRAGGHKFQQTPGNHTHKTHPQGCPNCAGRNPWALARFLEEAEKVHGGLYDYGKITSVTDSTTKLLIGCRTHGDFWQSPAHHIKRRQGCPTCGGTKKGSTERFIERARRVHGDTYNYSQSKYETLHRKLEIICPTHGSFWQSPRNHIIQKSGCPQCHGVKKATVEDFVSRARSKHGSLYDYSLVKMINMGSPVTIVCPFHGSFEQIPSVHLGGSGCKRCRNSFGHSKISRALATCGVDFKEEYPISDTNWAMPLWLDFAIFKGGRLVAAVEYHGEQHYRPVGWGRGGDFHNEAQLAFERIIERDTRKRGWCDQNNIKLLEISYTQLDLAARMAVDFALAQGGDTSG